MKLLCTRRLMAFVNDRKHASLLLSLTTLLLVALSGCAGFFVDPTLTSIVIAPTTPSIAQNATLQMTAAGSFDDGTTKKLTSSVSWSTSDNRVVGISDRGVVTGVSPGTASVTATSGTVTGLTTVVVTVTGLTSIAVTPTTASILPGQTLQFRAMGLAQNGQQQDISNAVTWTSSTIAVATIDAQGLATAKTASTASSTSITATSGNTVSNAAILHVSP